MVNTIDTRNDKENIFQTIKEYTQMIQEQNSWGNHKVAKLLEDQLLEDLK